MTELTIELGTYSLIAFLLSLFIGGIMIRKRINSNFTIGFVVGTGIIFFSQLSIVVIMLVDPPTYDTNIGMVYSTLSDTIFDLTTWLFPIGSIMSAVSFIMIAKCMLEQKGYRDISHEK